MVGEKHSRLYWWLIGGGGLILIGGCGLLLHSFFQVEYVLAEFDCGQGRRIVLYADTFCDQADIPLYEVWNKGVIVSPKYTTVAIFFCGSPMTAADLELVLCEDSDLAAVREISNGEVILVHDFVSSKTWPRNEDEEHELKRRLTAAGYPPPAREGPRAPDAPPENPAESRAPAER